MISKAIIEAVIKQAKPADKDILLSKFIAELSNYNYDDYKINRYLEFLLGELKPISPNDINMDYIKTNFSKYIYNPEDYIIKDVELESIDDIEGIIYINYKSKKKVDKDNTDIDFYQHNISINFIAYPQVLK